MANREVKLYLPEEVYEALEEAREVTGDRTPNLLAVEVIKRCLPIYVEAKHAFDAVLEDFLEAARARSAERREQAKPQRHKR